MKVSNKEIVNMLNINNNLVSNDLISTWCEKHNIIIKNNKIYGDITDILLEELKLLLGLPV